MRRRFHALFAVVLALGCAYAIDHFLAPLDYIIYALAIAEGLFASALPDILEPAWSRRHRGGLHSWRALLASLIACGLGVYLLTVYPPLYSHATLFIPLGYASHLMLDSLTPAGLPK